MGIDIGGTFTDYVGWKRGDPGLLTFKTPSTPGDFADGFRTGLDHVIEALSINKEASVVVMHGTTITTNTIIERNGDSIALFVTRGFRDLLELQRLRLKSVNDLFGSRTLPLVDRSMVFEVDERLMSDGSVREAIDTSQVQELARRAIAAGAKGFAIAFMHSYRDPVHEIAARDAIAEILPDAHVSLSSDIWPRIGEYERATLAVLNAYVQGKVDKYFSDVAGYLATRLPNARMFITRSNGGAMAEGEARQKPVHTLLSGPASGVTAAQMQARYSSIDKVLTMDMGGTSTDVSLVIEGRSTISEDAEVGDFPLIMPSTGIEAIGAGGGSIAWIDHGVLRVGPRSAGASPGPACFGRGGTQPTLSDAYLVCGYINPENFLGGRMTLDREAAQAALKPLADHLNKDVAATAQAIVNVATSNMGAQIMPYLARHTVDPRQVTLLPFGGAGGIHGPLLAAEIGLHTVLIPMQPSVFCALGGVMSDLVQDQVRMVQGQVVDSALIAKTFNELEAEAREWLSQQVNAGADIEAEFDYSGEVRYAGQSYQLTIPVSSSAAKEGDLNALVSAFHAEHHRVYTHSDPDARVEITALWVRIRGVQAKPGMAPISTSASKEAAVISRRQVYFGEEIANDTPVYDRSSLAPGTRLAGPAIIEQKDTTILLHPAFDAEVLEAGQILMTRNA
ncbi:hydantoinase/oxoprolinase family protein [Stappia sp. ES.058]|uniref:hydantoinase/oxoprolinase family protein n=1 Tax=Stappia sp. ES.058 TaxID=1881061 RepID=UPI001FCD4E5C|nr:hydantoinase/oxoprolinase family protein [Stappia sp. ES.058]